MARQGSTVLIGGGTGFVGSALCRALLTKGYDVTVVSRQPGPYRMTWTDLKRNGLPENVSAVVNTAGQNVFDIKRRWTPGFQQDVWSSRVNTTETMAKAIEGAEANNKPSVFVTMSGVGYYKPGQDVEYTEDSPGGNFDFLSDLVTAWEKAAQLPTSDDVRSVKIRSGVVLGREGGVVNQMYWPFYFGVGGPVASGKQYFPWIHLHDIVGLIIHAIENPKVTGVLNGVAPQIITNKQFASALGKAMWRPAIFPLPSFVLNMAFSEERAKIMTEGQKVIPKRTLESGYSFLFPEIESACKECARMIYADEHLTTRSP